jgi:hypothetical protein
MCELSISFITGMGVGIEFPGSFHEDMAWSVVVDLLIFRLTFVRWNSED